MFPDEKVRPSLALYTLPPRADKGFTYTDETLFVTSFTKFRRLVSRSHSCAPYIVIHKRGGFSIIPTACVYKCDNRVLAGDSTGLVAVGY